MPLLAPSITTTPHAGPSAAARGHAVRLPFIDNLRWVMIVLVVAMHAAVTYGIPGLWYYTEAAPLSRGEQLFFYAFAFFTKTFRMGILFFIAGYFVPGAYDRKGAGPYLRDRAYRLGLPTLLFMLILSPVTGWLGGWHRSAGSPLRSFAHEYKHYLLSGTFLSGFGPLWFCVLLLLFSCIYVACRELGPTLTSPASAPRNFPGFGVLLIFIALIGVCTFGVRVSWPIGTAFFNLQLGYFPQYVAFFFAGTLAWRHDWMNTLTASAGKRWGLIALVAGPLVWIALLFAGDAFNTPSFFIGGWHWQSLAISLLEAILGVGISLGIIAVFRDRFNRQGPRAAFLSANSFAVYVFHATILVAVSRAMAGWQASALLKFAVAAMLAVTLTYILAATLFRRIPLLKKIL
ncbi:MAG TPA: acyltransferase family protein [Puia sp.]|uniref:acyltransferase family protein n=1 Tax=Puia sp. TaxID=2045100 RepID=UPI002BBBC314|nr:acyltransferase family protein [Puia sp.]HVU95574.1 acyltransferase family protein [Puia sp.]